MSYIIALLLSFSAMAKVSVTWLGVGAIAVADGRNTLLFDPSFTTPGLLEIIGIKDFRSDEKLVREILNSYHIKEVDGVFVTHTHYDHVVDAPEVAKITGATLYGDLNLSRIARAYGMKVTPFTTLQIGKFKITAFERDHSKIFQWFEFLPGEVSENFSFNYYDYRVGKTWVYLIEHEEGNMIIDDSAGSLAKLPSVKVDVIIQGIANRRDDGEILEGYVQTFKPRIFIPIHFDNFFHRFQDRKDTYLPFVNFDRLQKSFQSQVPYTEFKTPVVGEKIKLF